MADYPKPPVHQPVTQRVRVEFGGVVIADTGRAIRALQTGIPPVYYVPPSDVRADLLSRTERTSHCPYKGDAEYWTVRVGDRVATNAAWSYPRPVPGWEAIAGRFAFYAHAMDLCLVGAERAAPPDWKWIGGWVTPGITGPFIGPGDVARH